MQNNTKNNTMDQHNTLNLKRSVNIVVVSLVVICCLNFLSNVFQSNSLEKLQTEADTFSNADDMAHLLKFHTVKINEFLTDAALTGHAEQFSEAEADFKAANVQLDELDKILPEYRTKTAEIRQLLKQHYETGQRMAEVYTTKGKALGDAQMAIFDTQTDTLYGATDILVGPIMDRNIVVKSQVKSKLSSLMLIALAVNVLSVVFIVFLLVTLIRRIYTVLGGEPAMAARYANAIAEGDFAALQSETNTGDASNLIQSLRMASHALVEIDKQMALMEDEHKRGNIDANIDVERFKGAYREMAIGINRMVANHIEVMRKSTACINGLAQGDFDVKLEKFPGKLELVNQGVEGLRYNIRTLISDLRHMSEEHQKGNISVMIDPEKFAGDYKLVAIGINEMVNEYIYENKTVIDCVSQFGNGDFSATIREFPGEKAFINKGIKKIGGNLKGLIDSVNWVSNEHVKGDIDSTLYDEMFKGDFSVLAKSVNTMMAGLLDMNRKSMAVIKAFGEGNFDAPLERFPGKKAFINDTIEQVRTNLKALNDDAQLLASAARDGRVSVRANPERHKGDYRKIVMGMNETLDMIVSPIATVKLAAETINTAAREIAQGNADLSRRTEEQASNLERTASSMTELAETVNQNAENAKQASQLAQSATQVAVKGGEAVSDVVNTMSAINDSARKIEDIIAVIDGIAFQTNILALNAAVEAARAGEQGRGFAVVAGEVRNLAQRSASAAKEIKELITSSVAKTNEGSVQVEAAGQRMQEIVNSVKRVSDIISEIASASAEQSAGINQVNDAVTKMDEVTQQNSALVEEAAAAAESLMEQAEEMNSAVSVFVLESNNTGSAYKKVANF